MQSKCTIKCIALFLRQVIVYKHGLGEPEALYGPEHPVCALRFKPVYILLFVFPRLV